MIHFNVKKYNSINPLYTNKYIIVIRLKSLLFTITYKNYSYSIELLNKYSKNILNFNNKEDGITFLKDFFIVNIWRNNFDIIRGMGYFYE